LKFPSIDTYHLIVFFYVCNEKNITLAAKKLCLSQPTVTKHIKSLEYALQAKLINIDRKRVMLTSVGEGLYTYAKEIYHQAVAAEHFIKQTKDLTLDIGSSQLFVQPISRTIQLLSQKMGPSIKFNVEFGIHAELAQNVIDSKLDVAILPNLGYGGSNVQNIRISNGIKLILFASPKHPIFRKPNIEWDDICDYPLLLSKELSSRKFIQEKLAAEGVHTPLKLGIHVNNVESRKLLVQDGTSISVALKYDLAREVNEGKLRIIELPDDIWIEVNAIIYRGALVSPVMQEFISQLRAAFEE
jgi:DNA-binding transcriptional LysR family regulator